MKKKILAIVLSIVAVILAAVIGVSVFFITDMNGSKNGKDVQIEIKQGTYTAKIAEILKDEGIINSPLGFRVFAKLKKYESKFKYGHYTFNTGDSYEEIAEKLITQGAKAATIKVTIPEGTGINDFVKNVNGKKVTVLGIASILEKAGVCQKADFISALNEVTLEGQLLNEANNKNTYYALEGYLFPETYFLSSKDVTVSEIFKVMLDETDKVLTSYKEKIEKSSYSIHKLMTLASITQSEGVNSDDFKTIASVFYNRLEDNTPLGSCVTSYYGVKKSMTEELYQKDIDSNNAYNTRGNNPKIISVGPISNPGLKAIDAVLDPIETDYYFFVSDKNRKLYFTKTNSEHERMIAKLQRDGLWYEW